MRTHVPSAPKKKGGPMGRTKPFASYCERKFSTKSLSKRSPAQLARVPKLVATGGEKLCFTKFKFFTFENAK